MVRIFLTQRYKGTKFYKSAIVLPAPKGEGLGVGSIKEKGKNRHHVGPFLILDYCFYIFMIYHKSKSKNRTVKFLSLSYNNLSIYKNSIYL